MERDRNILYVAPGLSMGGAERFLVQLINALTSVNFHQTLVNLSDVNTLKSTLDNSIEYHNIPRKTKFDISVLKKLRYLIIKKDPDVIFCINFFSFLMVRFALLGTSLKARRIISYHSTVHLIRRKDLLHQFASIFVNKSDLIITVCKNQLQYTARKYHLPEKRFQTIYNCVNSNYWQLPENANIKTEIRARLEIPMHAKVIVMAAGLRYEKNHIGAVNAFHHFPAELKQHTYLLLVGEGPMEGDIKKRVKELHLEHQVIFAGMQTDVRPYYWASDIFSLCSKSETFSIASLEAMACGLPAVLTDVGGANEMIIEGMNGFLCQLNDMDIAQKWERCLNNDFDSKAIHEYVKANFDESKMLGDYIQLLSK